MTSQTHLSSWVGAEGRFFERVSLVFEGLGYQPPRPDTGSEGEGAYVLNIANQYRADFTEQEVLSIVEYARHQTLAGLQRDKTQGWIDREAVFGERQI